MPYKSTFANLCAAVMVISVGRVACAEELPTAEGSDRIGGAGYLMSGIRHLDLAPLRARLRDTGYSSLGQTFFSLGGGGHVMLGRFRLGGEGHALSSISEDGSRANMRANVSGGYGMFRFGYAVVEAGRFSLYPMFGVGGGGLTLELTTDGNAEFDALLLGERQQASVSRGGLLFDAALGADYRVPFVRRDRDEGFVLVGLRASYTYAPAMGGWSTDAGDVGEGPDAELTGPSIHVLIGVGGIGATR